MTKAQRAVKPRQVKPQLTDLGKVSKETKVCGFPPEKRDNFCFWTKGPYV